MKNSYRCPTCARTIINMESQFRALDVEIENQPLPTPYNDWRCLISCNDCSAKSNVSFHFLGLKCDNCYSYNTSQVRIIRPEDGPDVADATHPLSTRPLSPGGLERSQGFPLAFSLGVTPRSAASTERGSTAADDGEEQAFNNANRALAAAEEAIQIANGMNDSAQGLIVDDGWETENSADFVDDDEEDEDDEYELEEEEEDDDDDDDDDDEPELIELRGHL